MEEFILAKKQQQQQQNNNNNNNNKIINPTKDESGTGTKMEEDDIEDDDDDEGCMSLNYRSVVFHANIEDEKLPLQVIVIHEPNYIGGGGMQHGGIDGLTDTDNNSDTNNDDTLSSSSSSSSLAQPAQPPASASARGRYLVLIRDPHSNALVNTLKCLDEAPEFFELDVGLVSGEVACVNRILHHAAQRVLESVADVLALHHANVNTNANTGEEDIHPGEDKPPSKEETNVASGDKRKVEKSSDINIKPETLPAIHFVGRSLAGGVASLAAAMLDGSIPMAGADADAMASNKKKKGKSKSKRRRRSASKSRHSQGGQGNDEGQDIGDENDTDTDHAINSGTLKIKTRKRRRRRRQPSDVSEEHDEISRTSNLSTNTSTSTNTNTSASTKKTRTRTRTRRRRQSDTSDQNEASTTDNPSPNTSTSTSTTLHGFGRGRTSAVALGAPPSLSANIKASFITSVILGDDIVCRSTQETLNRLRQRSMKRLQGNLLTKKVGWMTDTVSLTMASLQSHAHGSEGEEGRLAIPGQVYLVRPRSMKSGSSGSGSGSGSGSSNTSSMHEIGTGRDALRAAILWQLNDVLLSRSLWKHHSLDAYIRGLDKVVLRGVGGDNDDEENEDEEGGVEDYVEGTN